MTVSNRQRFRIFETTHEGFMIQYTQHWQTVCGIVMLDGDRWAMERVEGVQVDCLGCLASPAARL